MKMPQTAALAIGLIPAVTISVRALIPECRSKMSRNAFKTITTSQCNIDQGGGLVVFFAAARCDRAGVTQAPRPHA